MSRTVPQSWTYQRRPTTWARVGGMTLVELIVVVTIIGLVSAVVIPRLGTATVGRPGVRALARRLALDLRHARGLAIATGKNHYVGFDPLGYSVFRRDNPRDVAVDARRTLPRGLDGTITAWKFEFQPTGAALNGYRCDFYGSETTYRVQVIAATGTTTVRKL